MTQPTEDMSILQLGSLEQVSTIIRTADHADLPEVSCVTLCHNEHLIVGQFLDHYRALGVSRFFIVCSATNWMRTRIASPELFPMILSLHH